MEVLPSVKARTSDMFVRVRNAVLTRHVERDARPSVRADTRAFRSMALTGPITEGPRFGVPIPSPAGVSSEVPRSVQRRLFSEKTAGGLFLSGAQIDPIGRFGLA